MKVVTVTFNELNAFMLERNIHLFKKQNKINFMVVNGTLNGSVHMLLKYAIIQHFLVISFQFEHVINYTVLLGFESVLKGLT